MPLNIGNVDISTVLGNTGEEKPPASDSFVTKEETDGYDLNSGDKTLDIEAPDRAGTITISVETSGAAEAVLRFEDENGNVGTKRDKNDKSDYEVSGAGHIYLSTSVASPYMTLVLKDNSGAANSATWNVYVR